MIMMMCFRVFVKNLIIVAFVCLATTCVTPLLYCICFVYHILYFHLGHPLASVISLLQLLHKGFCLLLRNLDGGAVSPRFFSHIHATRKTYDHNHHDLLKIVSSVMMIMIYQSDNASSPSCSSKPCTKSSALFGEGNQAVQST